MVNRPAMNPPQFEWVKSGRPRKAQPAPPIYAPEIAADAIVWAASHRRREISVGMTTVAGIWGNKMAAGLGDRDLARLRYDAQQADEPADPHQPGNPLQPLPGGHRAHSR